MWNLLEYALAIVDECGYVVEYVSELNDDEVEEILEMHPEWRTKCVGVNA